MKWYYVMGPEHTRVRVFMNGANCGDLCFRTKEFEQLYTKHAGRIQFIDETPAPKKKEEPTDE